ncbi:SAM-dependent methyltransferase [Paenibacillus dokdonensis]|uniref:SAM-dependent methyltransferase n=1 Tax=Paenibacillus dokdonensis TaxID=2567944 RepID=UPI0010A77854|nr:SAM-dependent methyltransferase [Paenibacillus dokdonensis]
MSRAEKSKELEEKQVHALEEAELRLERIVFIGRTFDEYMRMFGLDEKTISGLSILDCPGGACSFTAIARKLGCEVLAADIAYYHDTGKLYEKGIQDIVHAMEHVETEKERYIWTEFLSVEDLRAERNKALQDSVSDMRLYPERYIPVTLPSLPFQTEQFDMTLSAHFLFTYADKLDIQFHLETLRELFRVTRAEVRIFPLVDQSGRIPEQVDKLVDFAHTVGWTAEIKTADYHFQKNADHMLIFRNTHHK